MLIQLAVQARDVQVDDTIESRDQQRTLTVMAVDTVESPSKRDETGLWFTELQTSDRLSYPDGDPADERTYYPDVSVPSTAQVVVWRHC